MLLSMTAALLLAISPQTAVGQAATAVDDVMVEGVRRNEKTTFDFIRSVSAPPFGARTMAVWTGPICLSIDNLRPEASAALRDRVLGRVQGMGVEVGASGCRPNVIVIFTADAQATADDLVTRNRSAFRPTTGATQQDRGSLRRFVSSDRPVRWWSVSMPVDVDSGRRTVSIIGEHGTAVHYQSPGVAGAQGQAGGPPWRRVRGIQPRGDNVRDVLQISFIIVDAERAEGTSLAALADYMSMVMLSQVDPEADISGRPTILRLFEAEDRPQQLTQWDQDYLRALYAAPVAWSNIRFQQEEIARRMVTDTPTGR